MCKEKASGGASVALATAAACVAIPALMAGAWVALSGFLVVAAQVWLGLCLVAAVVTAWQVRRTRVVRPRFSPWVEMRTQTALPRGTHLALPAPRKAIAAPVRVLDGVIIDRKEAVR